MTSKTTEESIVGEIKTDITKAAVGTTHVFEEGDYLITEKHTLNDILRFLIQQAGGKEEVQSLLFFLEGEDET